MFRVVAPDIPETLPTRPGGRYADLVRRAALAKAESVARRETGTVLAADTIVVCDGELLGKPSDEDDARRMLHKLSGRPHRVYTGVALLRESHRRLDYECTEVTFRRLSKEEVERYISTGEPMDKAGSYAIQGGGAALIRSIRGCFTNVIGLPLPKVLEMVKEFEPGGPAARRGGRSTRR